MKQIKTLLIAAILILGANETISAQAKTAHVDVNELTSKMPAILDAQKQLQKLGETYNTEYNAMVTEYKTKIEFYFVTDDAQKDVLAFKKTTDFLYPIFYIGSSAPKPLDVKLAPKTYFISKTGRIVYDVSEPVFWNLESVKKTLDELIKK